MDNKAFAENCGHRYSVDLCFVKNPFVTYPVAYFDDLDDAYNWLSNLHDSILCEHYLEICDKDGDCVFQLSHFYKFDDYLNEGHFITRRRWLVSPQDYELPF